MVSCTKINSSTGNGQQHNYSAIELHQRNISMSNDVSYHEHKISSSSSAAAAAVSASVEQSISSAERILVSIHDLLARKLSSDERLRREMDNDQQIMSEWAVAAAVIDRICFIALALLLVAGTAVFLVLLFIRH